jgi:hypothetical protein
VKREWANAKRFESEERLYKTLLQRYTLRVEPTEGKQMAEMSR